MGHQQIATPLSRAAPDGQTLSLHPRLGRWTAIVARIVPSLTMSNALCSEDERDGRDVNWDRQRASLPSGLCDSATVTRRHILRLVDPGVRGNAESPPRIESRSRAGDVLLHVPAKNVLRRWRRRPAPCPHDRPTEDSASEPGVPARLLTVYGSAAPDVLRRRADELEWLELERAVELIRQQRDSLN